MRFLEIFRFEFTYQLRRPFTWLFFIALFGISILLTRDGTVAEALHDDFLVNSPFAIAKTTIVSCLIWLLVTGFVAGEAASRDVSTGMYPLSYTLRITKGEYLGGRFMAALIINIMMHVGVQIGIIVAVYAPGVDAELIGPFRILAYANNFIYLALPNVLAGTALQFAVASRTGKPMTAFFGSFFLFLMSYVVGLFLLLQGRGDLANLLDPIGVHFILSQLSHQWTPTEKSYRLVTFEGIVMTNRLLWLGFAIVTMVTTYIRFSFRHRVESSWLKSLPWRKREQTPTPASAVVHPTEPVYIPQVQRVFGLKSHARQVFTITSTSYRTTAWSFAGLFMLVVIPLMNIPVIIDQMEVNGVPIVPTTNHVLMELTAPLSAELSRWVIIPLLITFFAGGLVWREWDARVSEINDALPISEWTSLLGKFFGLCMVLVLFTVFIICSSIIAQVVLGYDQFEIGLYLKILFGLQLPEYILFAMLALVLHAVVSQKYVGHLVVTAAFVLIAFAPIFGLEHNLLIYSASPSWSYTDMRGFAGSIGPWLWFKAYWFSWALLLAVIGRLLWIRGKETDIRKRIKLARPRFTGSTVVVGVIAMGMVLVLGSYIFYNTNVLNEYQNVAGTRKLQAENEKKYKKYEHTDQPVITAVKSNVDLDPKNHSAEVRGNYTLLNNNKTTIDSMLLSTINGYEVVKLERPLAPGDTLLYPLDLSIHSHGFAESGNQNPVHDNGTYLSMNEWLPSIGYNWTGELNVNTERRKYGLKARSLIPSLYDKEARKHREPGIVFEAVVSTDEGQFAVAPGALKKEWTENGRRYFHYATGKPIGNEWPIASAKYEKRIEQWSRPDSTQVAIQVYTHPGHKNNLERILNGLHASLDYYSQQFGPYEYDYLTLVEKPGNGNGMHADASIISFTEGFSLWGSPEEAEYGLDLPYAVAAHEMAHQWTVPYASVEGAPVMSESLAWYYGIKLVAHNPGEAQLNRLLSFMREPFPYPPIRHGEPLLRGLDPYLSYRRGPFALYAISKYIGDEKTNGALKSLLEKHLPDSAELATTLDLYEELKLATPDSLHYLLHDLFEVNTYWDMSVDKAEVNGSKLKIDVSVNKTIYDSAGVESTVPLNDWIEIGASDQQGQFYLQKHYIKLPKQTIILDLPRQPSSVAIDPNKLLIDLDQKDNSREVKLNDK